jgi:nitroimidazol reductase NimA-like FMN-containing flavoprotein (pyridoxamine 5'-phosphate oxidase superfamily)
MTTAQGSLALLNDPVAQELLLSNIPARLAYVWPDGTPRVVPVWYHWNGSEFVIVTPPKAPKLKALKVNPKVALTIDDNTFPHKVLMVRGTATFEELDGIVPEYQLAAHRYFGEAQGKAWVEQVRQMLTRMVRISIKPEWVGILDFQSRFPSALSS